MSAFDDKPEEGGFLSRWSRRKLEARVSPAPNSPPPVPATSNPSAGAASGPEVPQSPHQSKTLPAASPSPELPPLETLTPEADFTPFMAKGVESNTRNAALKTLFTDPHFNQMDGLDVYIDDYTQHTPIPMEMLRSLKQAQMLFADEKKEEGKDVLRQDQYERVEERPALPVDETKETASLRDEPSQPSRTRSGTHVEVIEIGPRNASGATK